MNDQNKLDAWLLKLHNANWDQLGSKERLKLLQELEKIMAAEQGRMPKKIRVMPKGLEEENTLGVCNGFGIYISSKFLEKSKSAIFSNNDTYSVGNAINTIIHEGRHAWQRRVAGIIIRQPNVDQTTRAKILANELGYTSSMPVYFAQLIELDARRYARQRYDQLLDRMRKLGWEPEDVYLRQREMDRCLEAAIAAEIKANVTEEQLDRIDARTLRQWKESISTVFPEADISSIGLFEDARKLLRNEISEEEFVDGKPMAFTDADRLRVKARMDAVSATFEDSFWKALGAPVDTSQAAEKPDDLKIKPIGTGKTL